MKDKDFMSGNKVNGLCTVLITAYQREKYIIKTVNSVLNQTYRPIELIVIDDGSTDSTFELLKGWEKQLKYDSDFKTTILKQENTGAPKARNRALSISTGEFIQEIGSDDLIHPQKLELQIDALNKNKNCYSAWNPLLRFEDEEEQSLFRALKAKYAIEDVSENLFIPQFMPSAAIHRRCVFANTGLWTESLKRWQDLEYQVRMMLVIDSYLKFDTPLYFFRQHNNGRINDMFKEKNGINFGFHSLDSVQKYLSPDQKKQETIKKTMRDMYLSLFNTAIVNSLKKESIMSLEYALKWSGANAFAFKIFFLITILKLSSIKFSKFILSKTKYFSNDK